MSCLQSGAEVNFHVVHSASRCRSHLPALFEVPKSCTADAVLGLGEAPACAVHVHLQGCRLLLLQKAYPTLFSVLAEIQMPWMKILRAGYMSHSNQRLEERCGHTRIQLSSTLTRHLLWDCGGHWRMPPAPMAASGLPPALTPKEWLVAS